MTSFDYPSGATPLSEDEAQGLLVPGITTRDELNVWEQRNILAGQDWARTTRKMDPFNEAFILELHRRMFGDVWGWAGGFRSTEKNIGVPVWNIGAELKKVCDDARVWVASNGYPPDEAAARLHHRLVWIHPFANGNGRHSRMWADFVLVRIFKQPRFSWGGDNLDRQGAGRDAYLKALRAADAKDIGPLLEFVRS